MGYDPYKSNAEKKGKGGQFLAFDWKGKKVKFWKPKETGDYRLDIIPYKIATKAHPECKRGASVGDEVYSLDFSVHKYIGPGQYTVVCPKETYGKPCPICEEADKILRESGRESKEYGALKAKHRVLYNVTNPDDENEEIMLFEETFAYFEQELNKYAASKGRRTGKDFVRFADVTEGKTVVFTATESTFNGGKFFKYGDWDFEQRDHPHNKSIIDKAYALDEYLMTKTYEELQALLYGSGEEEEADEPEEKPAKAEAKETGTCPSGKKFGKDYDRADDACDLCDVWKACRTAQKEGA